MIQKSNLIFFIEEVVMREKDYQNADKDLLNSLNINPDAYVPII